MLIMLFKNILLACCKTIVLFLIATSCHNVYIFGFHLLEAILKVNSNKWGFTLRMTLFQEWFYFENDFTLRMNCKMLFWEWLLASEGRIYRFYDKKEVVFHQLCHNLDMWKIPVLLVIIKFYARIVNSNRKDTWCFWMGKSLFGIKRLWFLQIQGKCKLRWSFISSVPRRHRT